MAALTEGIDKYQAGLHINPTGHHTDLSLLIMDMREGHTWTNWVEAEGLLDRTGARPAAGATDLRRHAAAAGIGA